MTSADLRAAIEQDARELSMAEKETRVDGRNVYCNRLVADCADRLVAAEDIIDSAHYDLQVIARANLRRAVMLRRKWSGR